MGADTLWGGINKEGNSEFDRVLQMRPIESPLETCTSGRYI